MITIQQVYTLLFSAALVSQVTYGYNIGYDGTDAWASYESSWGKERFDKQDYLYYFQFYKKYVEKLSFVDVADVDIAQLPYPYCDLTEIKPYNRFGMYFNSEYVQKLIAQNPHVQNVVEIGSYYGLSTRHIASLLPTNGKVYAVDNWLYFEGMYEQFLSNVVQAGLTDKIVPVRKASQEAVPLLRLHHKYFDMIYVDGDHETLAVYRDLEKYYPLLSDRGVICGDDWLLITVRAAVVLFAQKHNLTVYADCNFWFLKDEGAYRCDHFLNASDTAWQF